jgi:hypothetical protein
VDRWVPELFLVSLLAAFCGGLAWIHDHELFAAALPRLRLLQLPRHARADAQAEEIGAKGDGDDHDENALRHVAAPAT